MKKKEVSKELTTMFQDASKHLAQNAASAAFEFWQRKDFRLYVAFQTLSQTEQDRMFNEFEVSVLGLYCLHIDDAIATAEEGFIPLLHLLQKELVASFLAIMEEARVEKQFLKQWDTLIQLRLKEYRGDVTIARKESSTWKELESDEEIRYTWSRIETMTIDCLSHIRRGEVKEGDPLWKLLRKWILTLDTSLSPMIKMAQGEKKKN